MTRKTIAYLLAVIFIFISLFVLIRGDYLSLITKISLGDFFISVIIALSVFFLSGCKIAYLSSSQLGVKLGFIDIVTLPMAMNFWSYVIPKGGMLYSTFFLKAKYGIKAAHGFSITIYIYIMVVVLAGFFGLYYTISRGFLFSLGALVSVVLILSPFLIKLLDMILGVLPLGKLPFAKNVQGIIHTIISNSTTLWSNVTATTVIFIMTLGHIILRVFWLYWAVHVFEMDVPLIALIELALIAQLSIIIRFIPGNIGLNELISGGALSILGGTMGGGILISLFTRFSTLVLTFTIGSLSVIVNVKHFNMESIKTMFAAIKKSDQQ